MALNDEARSRFDKIDEGISKLFDLQRDTNQRLNDHMAISGVHHAEAVSTKQDIDAHLEDHKEKRGWFAALWIGMLGTMAATLWNWLTNGKGGHQ